jgi:hypothetical protein
MAEPRRRFFLKARQLDLKKKEENAYKKRHANSVKYKDE